MSKPVRIVMSLFEPNWWQLLGSKTSQNIFSITNQYFPFTIISSTLRRGYLCHYISEYEIITIPLFHSTLPSFLFSALNLFHTNTSGNITQYPDLLQILENNDLSFQDSHDFSNLGNETKQRPSYDHFQTLWILPSKLAIFRIPYEILSVAYVSDWAWT